MRWPIRNQILLPFVAIQVLTVGSIAVTTSWLAVRTAEEGIQSKLASVVATLEGASFPLTPSVLRQLKSLSGAELLLVDGRRRVVESTFPKSSNVAAALSDQNWQRLDRTVVGDYDPVEIAGERFFAGRVRWVDSRGGGFVIVLFPHADWRAAQWAAISPPLLIGCGLLIFTVTASIYLSRRLGGRIHRVQAQVAKIADGDFEPIPTSRVDDELRDLSLGVNRMASALEESLQRVRESERSALLTQLVGGVAHQLRNAITGARISVQLHQRRCEKREDDALAVALKQLRLTEEQIKSLLRVTRGESRSSARGDLSEILDGTLALITPICEHQKLALKVDSKKVHWIIDDADAMRAALLNLLMNAVEAAGPKGMVRVETRAGHARLHISIADNGPGFPEGVDIFQTFYSSKPEGVGLGLSLARQAVEDCGGSLTARREDGMTVFEITLAQASCREERPMDSAQHTIPGAISVEVP